MFSKILFLISSLFVFEKVANANVVISPLSNETQLLQELTKYKVYRNICDQYIDRYTVIKNIEYYDFNGNLLSDGVMVVQDVLADSVVKIFNDLKQIKFPIAKIDPKMGRTIKPVKFFGFFGLNKVETNEEFADNFTGSFSCRNIEHTKRLSLHSFGTAIDINILQNPCIFIDNEKRKIINVVPKDGVMYLNRKIKRPNKPDGFGKVDDKIIAIFRKHGFDVWGGYWDYPIDYQHFQVSNRKFAELLINANKEDAKKIFNQHIECLQNNDKSLSEMADENNIILEEQYNNDNSENKIVFFDVIKNICKKNENIKPSL
jgi:hypothetical protein